MAFDFPTSPTVGTLFAPAGGPTWRWDGTVWATVSPTGMPEAPLDNLVYGRQNGLWTSVPISNMVVTVITTPGAGNYVKSFGLKFLEVTLVGGGGGGSRAGATAATTASAGGGGGGAGTCISLFKASDLAAIEPYVIGAGGTGGSVAGGAGGDSTFQAMTAGGGTGGGALLTAAATAIQSARGSGGVATGGQINIKGGGAEAGTANTANNGWGKAGAGGVTPFAPYIATVNTGSVFTPFLAQGYGGGSSGGASGFSQASPPATSPGGDGVLILKEYF